MQTEPNPQAPPAGTRGKGRRKAALHLFLLLGLPLLLLSSVFLTGAYWGSSKCPAWLLEKEASWFGWTAKPEALAAAQRIKNRRNGLGAPALTITDEAPGSGDTPSKEIQNPGQEQPQPTPNDSPKPQIQPATDSGPAKIAQVGAAAQKEPEPAPAQDPSIKALAAQEAARDRTPPGRELPTLESPSAAGQPTNPGDSAQAPAKSGEKSGARAGARAGALENTTLKDRFDLPAKVGVMLVVDAQAFSGRDSCQRARSALHSANMQTRAWLNLSLDARGCLPWVAKSDKPRERGKALAALDLPGTDLLMVISRPARITMPSLQVERDVFNAGLALALVPGGGDDAAMRRSILHALGVAMGAQPITDPGAADARRGSVMAKEPLVRKDWLDEANRWRLLERKQWPFARRPAQGGQ